MADAAKLIAGAQGGARRATSDDIPAVLALLHLMHREAPHGALSEARVRDAVDACMGSGAVILSCTAGEPVGTLGLHLRQPWWSEDWEVADTWLFVHPAHRRAPHARLLLGIAKDFARGMGLPLVMGVFSTKRTAPKLRLFERILGAPAGGIFLVEP